MSSRSPYPRLVADIVTASGLDRAVNNMMDAIRQSGAGPKTIPIILREIADYVRWQR